MRARAWVAIAACAAVVVAGTASGSTGRVAGTLRVSAKLATAWKFADKHCPAGKPVNISCVQFIGTGPIAGLGMARSTYVKTMESNGCPITQFNNATIFVARKGTLKLSRPGKACGPTAPARVGPLSYTVSGGTGTYRGASGRLTYRGWAGRADFTCGPCGKGEDTWSGTVTVPGLAFDLTPPAIEGAISQTVQAAEGAKAVAASYTVTALDANDGPRPVACRPRSGSLFKIGSTKVTCGATDLDGNTSSAIFTITVEPS